MNSKTLRVASDCKWVAEQATHVKINYDKIGEYAEFILKNYNENFIEDLSDDVHHVSTDREDTLSYILALEAINFGSGYFESARLQHGIKVDYDFIASGLKNSFEKARFNTPKEWSVMQADDFYKIYPTIVKGQYEQVDEMFKLFAKSISDVGSHIENEFSGRVENFYNACDNSAMKMSDIVAGWDSFKDCANYRGREVYILKRAQILAADIDLVYKEFTDMDKITIFADNKVPHTLRYDDIIEYSEDLQNIINNREPIKSGSEEEIEMRAVSIHVVELMKEFLHASGRTEIRSVDLDRLLWHRGEYEEKFTSKPCHITKTTCY